MREARRPPGEGLLLATIVLPAIATDVTAPQVLGLAFGRAGDLGEMDTTLAMTTTDGTRGQSKTTAVRSLAGVVSLVVCHLDQVRDSHVSFRSCHGSSPFV
jgi:hypothetical protein